jgi:hypothetical protein
MSGGMPQSVCDLARESLISDYYAGKIPRHTVETHLQKCNACLQWAAESLVVTYLVSAARRNRAEPEISDDRLNDYLDGGLSEAQREAVEDACCYGLAIAGRLQRLTDQHVADQVGDLDVQAAYRLVQALRPTDEPASTFPLKELRGLYQSGAQAAAAAQSERSSFQTRDGRFAISVHDLGPIQAGGPHGVELAFRAHDPRLVGRWAAYRLTDTRGDLAAVGVVKVEDSGGSIYLTVVPTKPNVARAKPTPLVNTDLRGRLKLNPSG